MTQKQWVVRFVIPFNRTETNKYSPTMEGNTDLGAFIECLRYAGVVNTHQTEDNQLIDLYCPNSKRPSETKAWAEMQVRRMKTFGFNVAAAPAMGEN